MEILFCFSCMFLAIGLYAGLVSTMDDIAVLSLLTVLNTVILVFIMGVLVYG